jgi:chromosomal replication initiation ATPase DnaA
MRDATAKPHQLALDLPVDVRHGVEDFLVGPSNEAAYGLVESWPAWPDAFAGIIGPEGAGKTHLAAIWAEAAHAWTVAASALTAAEVPHLVSNGALVIEDCDRGPLDEAAFFHLMNAIKARGGHLLMTAGHAPDHWGLATPDLRSRLRLAPQAEIAPPDDMLLKAVLVKLFLDRQLIVDMSVVETLSMRMERSFAAARQLVDALDKQALERGKRVTRAMALDLTAAMG